MRYDSKMKGYSLIDLAFRIKTSGIYGRNTQ